MQKFAHSRWVLVSGIATMVVACSTSAPVNTQKITLFFYSQEDYDNAEYERPIPVIRQIPKNEEPKDAALKLLFAGPTKAEQDLGAITSNDLTHLGDYYLGVSQEGEIAIVNFQADALEILNSAAARQFMAKSPIEDTVKQFGDVTTVQYAIDGQIFEEWDA